MCSLATAERCIVKLAVLAFGLLLFCPLHVATAFAQVDSSPPIASPLVPPPANDKLLSADKRLSLLVPGSQEMLPGRAKRVRMGRVFSWIGKYTHVGLSADYENMSESSIYAVFDTIKASDLMDGLAALYMVRWEKDTPNSYRVIGPESEMDFVYLPQSDARRERNTAGIAFMTGIEALPKEGVAGDLLAGKKVNVSDLPPALQKSLGAIIAASDKEFSKSQQDLADSIIRVGGVPNNDINLFPLERLSQATVSQKREQKMKGQQGFSTWFIDVALEGWGSTANSVTDYEQQMRKRPKNANEAVYELVKYPITPEMARELPELRKQVHLNMPQATAGEVLEVLNEQYGIAILSVSPEFMKERADVVINAETIAEAFDALTEAFPGTQWEYRPSKFFIFRKH